MNRSDEVPFPQGEDGKLLTAMQTPAAWATAGHVPFRLAVTVSLIGIRLQDLQRLRPGTTLLTLVPAAEDVPVRVGGALLGWGELDNVDGQMAIRLTRLA